MQFTISKINPGKVDLILLDGNLSTGKSDGSEGRVLLKLIREKDQEIKVIGIAQCPITGVDVSVRKGNLKTLKPTINSLFSE